MFLLILESKGEKEKHQGDTETSIGLPPTCTLTRDCTQT